MSATTGARHPAQRDAGFTLVEIVISIVLSSIVAGVTVAIMVTSLNLVDATSDISADATDAGLIAAFLYRDAQAAGGTDPRTLAELSELGVSSVDWGGCPQDGELVVRFSWIDRLATSLEDPMTVTWALLDDGRLVRRACQDSTSADVPLGEHVGEASLRCLPGPACDRSTEAIELTLTGSAAVNPTTFSLSATMRNDLASGAAPTGRSAPLILFGDAGSCPRLTLDEGTVVVVGDALIDQACGDRTVSGDPLRLQTTGSLSAPTGEPDPMTGVVPDPPSCAAATDPPFGASPSATSTVVHTRPVVVSGAASLQPGRHVFCAGLRVASDAVLTGSDVVLQVVDGDVEIDAGARVELSAANAGPWANLLLATTGERVSIAGATTPIVLRGVVHAPGSTVTVGTGVGVAVGALIAGELVVSGAGPLRFGLPLPTILVEPIELAPAQVNADYPAVEMIADAGTAPYSWSATGLPAGLGMTSGGLLAGVPVDAGDFTVTITVTDATGLVEIAERRIMVKPELTIAGPRELAIGQIGLEFPASTVEVTGGTLPYALAAEGLPAGIRMSPDGVISGVPTTIGDFEVTIVATDAIFAATKRSYRMSVRAALTIDGPDRLAGGSVGAAWTSAAVTATGGLPPYRFSGSGLPPGVVIATDGTVSGTPTAAGAFGIDIVVTDTAGATASKTYDVVVTAPTTSAKPLARTSRFQVFAEGNGTLGTWDIEGAVAVGGDLTFRNHQRIATREPSAVVSHTGGQPLGLLVGGRVDLAGAGSDRELTVDNGWFVVGSAPSQSLLAFGSELHLVPVGVTDDWTTPRLLSEDNQTTLAPNAAVLPNAYPFADAFTALRTNSARLATLSSATRPAVGDAKVDVADGNHTVTLTPGRVNVWTITLADITAMNNVVSSTLPNAGTPLVINVTDADAITLPVRSWDFLRQSESRGAILWNFPNASSVAITQSFPGSLLAPNAHATFQDVTVDGDVVAKTVDFSPWEADLVHFEHDVPCLGGGAPYIDTPGKLSTLQVGVTVSPATFTAAGGAAPYSWSAAGLPAGLAISPEGALTGIPEEAGTADVVVSIVDAAGARASRTYRIVVNPAPTVDGGALPPGQVGVPYPVTQLTVAGGTAPFTWASPALPAGLTLTSTGLLAGIPTDPTPDGAVTVSVTVSDAAGGATGATYTLFIAEAGVPAGCPLAPAGWRAEYYPNTTLSGSPALCRDDPAVVFNWAGRSPGGSVPATNFSARWTRRQHFEAGTYEFTKGSDDGFRLYVDGRLVIADWRLQSYGGSMRSGQIELTEGHHTLVAEYYQGRGQSRVQLDWAQVEVTPCGEASTDAWIGSYYSNRTLSGDPSLCRKDAAIDFNWRNGSPSVGIPADGFSVSWTHVVEFPTAGRYRFTAGSDDGARVYIDDELVIDTWRDRSYRTSTADVTLTAGRHTIRYEFYENRGQARATLVWTKVS